MRYQLCRGAAGCGAVSVGPSPSAVVTDRGLTAAKPLYHLTSATVPTARDIGRKANRGGGAGIDRVHRLQRGDDLDPVH